MTDRELIGIEVNSLLRHIEFDHIDARASLADDIADAVIAAIGDRLLPEKFQVGDVVHVAGKGNQRFEIVVHRREQYGVCREGAQENHRIVDPTSIIAIRNALEGES